MLARSRRLAFDFCNPGNSNSIEFSVPLEPAGCLLLDASELQHTQIACSANASSPRSMHQIIGFIR